SRVRRNALVLRGKSATPGSAAEGRFAGHLLEHQPRLPSRRHRAAAARARGIPGPARDGLLRLRLRLEPPPLPSLGPVLHPESGAREGPPAARGFDGRARRFRAVTTGLVFDEVFLRHRPPSEHPEHPGRLAAIWKRLKEIGLLDRCRRIPAREATRDELLEIHTPDHVDRVFATARRDFVQLDPDTYTSRDSAEAARKAAGGVRTVNVPWPAGMGDAEYLAAFDRVLLPIAREFRPDLVLVSCGFDAAAGDLLGGMLLSPAGYAAMTERVASLAGGRVVLALEGGYNLDAIAAAAAACTRTLLDERTAGPDAGPPNAAAERVIRRTLDAQRPYWPGL